MSIREYKASQRLEQLARQLEGSSFYSLLMAAMRVADDYNLAILKEFWPDEYEELRARYNAPGGKLPEDTPLNPTRKRL